MTSTRALVLIFRDNGVLAAYLDYYNQVMEKISAHIGRCGDAEATSSMNECVIIGILENAE